MYRNLGLAGLVLLAVVGCGQSGPKLLPVRGKVLVDGSPKAKLNVTFSPVKGVLGAVGVTNEQGEYELKTNGRSGAMEGEYKVSITTIFDDVEPPKQNTAAAPSGGDAYMNQADIGAKQFKMPKETIPARYNTNSDLMRTVNADFTEFDFEIDTKTK